MPRSPHRRRRSASDPGFTLVELLVVIIVLGLLAAIVIFTVGRTTDEAQTVACKTERDVIDTALERYKAEHDGYPTTAQGLAILAVGQEYLKSTPSSAKWIYNPAGSAIGVGTCAALPGADTPEISGTVTIWAATSLTNVFNDIKAKLQAVNPDLNLQMTYGGSATLKGQINSGTSPVDAFAAADELNSPNAPLVASTNLFASNKLAIITRPGNPTGVTALADLFTAGKQVVICQTAQPCGTASNASFATIGRIRADLGTNLVSETANVGAVTIAVQGGASNTVGIVYITDAIAAGSTVTTVSIPDANNPGTRYPIYQLTGGSNAAGAQKFIDYVLSPEGQAILAARKFGPKP